MSRAPKVPSVSRMAISYEHNDISVRNFGCEGVLLKGARGRSLKIDR